MRRHPSSPSARNGSCATARRPATGRRTSGAATTRAAARTSPRGARESGPGLAQRARQPVQRLHVPARAARSASPAACNRYFTEIYPLGLLRNYYIDGVGALREGRRGARAGEAEGVLEQPHRQTPARSTRPSASARWAPPSRPTSSTARRSSAAASSWLGEHQVNIGVEGRLKRVAWTYLDDLREEIHAAAFVQDEWRIVQPLRLIVSYRVDRHPLLDKGNPGIAQSPRVSAVFQPIEGHAFRAPASPPPSASPRSSRATLGCPVPVPGVNGARLLTTGATATLRPERLNALRAGLPRRVPAPRSGLGRGALPEHGEGPDRACRPCSRCPPASRTTAAAAATCWAAPCSPNEAAIYTARGVEAGINVSPIDGLGVKASASFQHVSSDMPERGPVRHVQPGAGRSGSSAASPTARARTWSSASKRRSRPPPPGWSASPPRPTRRACEPHANNPRRPTPSSTPAWATRLVKDVVAVALAGQPARRQPRRASLRQPHRAARVRQHHGDPMKRALPFLASRLASLLSGGCDAPAVVPTADGRQHTAHRPHRGQPGGAVARPRQRHRVHLRRDRPAAAAGAGRPLGLHRRHRRASCSAPSLGDSSTGPFTAPFALQPRGPGPLHAARLHRHGHLPERAAALPRVRLQPLVRRHLRAQRGRRGRRRGGPVTSGHARPGNHRGRGRLAPAAHRRVRVLRGLGDRAVGPARVPDGADAREFNTANTPRRR